MNQLEAWADWREVRWGGWRGAPCSPFSEDLCLATCAALGQGAALAAVQRMGSILVLVTPHFDCPDITSVFHSRHMYPTACYTSPFGILLGISISTYPIPNSQLPPKHAPFSVFPISVNNESIIQMAQEKFGVMFEFLHLFHIFGPSTNPFGSTFNIHPETTHFSLFSQLPPQSKSPLTHTWQMTVMKRDSEWYSQKIMIQNRKFILYVFIKLNPLFKIIVDSHAVKK